jgi:hypothetical protein
MDGHGLAKRRLFDSVQKTCFCQNPMYTVASKAQTNDKYLPSKTKQISIKNMALLGHA